jgi:TolB-like protein/tetratricopeptide (TPR) repeat protein
MASFLGEIKRRKVFQVAVVYIVVAWAIIQVIDVVVEPLRLPDWFDTVAIVLLIAGFPIALVLAWALDLTPRGIVRTPASELEEQTQADAEKPDDSAETLEILPNSVAVLPFENLSVEKQDAFFAVGIHEAILNELAKIKNLAVMARTSVLRYADGQTPISQIVEDLKVQTVMEGSVQYADDQVRITAQLIDGATGAHLWSEVYDRQFSDIFSIQSDIATRIASALKDGLTPRERETLSRVPTESAQAYGFYLRALATSLSGGLEVTPEESATLLANLDEALALDPDFALAYALKAREYAYSMARSVRRDDELTIALRDQLAQENAGRALALDPNSGLAYAALAVAHRFGRRDGEAETAFERALTLYPSDPRVLRDIAFFNIFRGRYDHALEFVYRLVDVDPVLGNYLMMQTLWFLGELDEAQAAVDKVLAILPNNWAAHIFAGLLAVLKGDPAAAAKSFQLSETFGLAELGAGMLAWVGLGYELIGRIDDARRVFETIESLAQEYIVSDAIWVMAYLAIDDKDNALRSLRRAADHCGPGEDIFEALVAFNMLRVPTLEEPDFVKARRALGVVAKAH